LEEDILSNPLGIPFSRLSFNQFVQNAFLPSFNVLKAYGTTIGIVGFSILGVLFCTTMLSYIMARNPKSRFVEWYQILLLAGLIIPPQVILLSIVQILRDMGLMFTWTGLILRNIGWYIPFSCFVYIGYIKTIPRELDESAFIDGASLFQIFRIIILPLIKPATASVFIFCFLWIWNDFLNPQIILGSSGGYTVTTGIYRAVGQYNTAWDQIFSLVVWASFPVLIMFFLMQRHFISGLTAGSIKG
jgi:raffinose/stachyose/melibiose transport system permease protein